ncbi:MAG: 2-oxo-4-hydroxy-4-carboxy-5-ureidoimidazoline decarboxylase [Solirubrobacteraceae bacterium]
MTRSAGIAPTIELLLAACGARRWASGVAAAAPFATHTDLLDASERAFSELGREDWLEAFAAHARLGEPRTEDPTGSAEQRGVGTASASELAALRAGNDEYEARFGHVFLIRAQGLSAGEMLVALRERLHNSPEVELEIAAEQQREITRLRLDAILAA